MIVRILTEGQWELRRRDAVRTPEPARRRGRGRSSGPATRPSWPTRCTALLEQVRTAGTPVPDDQLLDSDLILPGADATLDEVQELLSGSEEGLVPN